MARSLVLKSNIASLVEGFLSGLAASLKVPPSQLVAYHAVSTSQGETIDPLVRCLTGSLVHQSPLDGPSQTASRLAKALERFEFNHHPGSMDDELYWLHIGDNQWVSVEIEGHSLSQLFEAYDVPRGERFVVPFAWKATHGEFEA